jgi:hypothetical protein
VLLNLNKYFTKKNKINKFPDLLLIIKGECSGTYFIWTYIWYTVDMNNLIGPQIMFNIKKINKHYLWRIDLSIFFFSIFTSQSSINFSQFLLHLNIVLYL